MESEDQGGKERGTARVQIGDERPQGDHADAGEKGVSQSRRKAVASRRELEEREQKRIEGGLDVRPPVPDGFQGSECVGLRDRRVPDRDRRSPFVSAPHLPALRVR